MFNRIYDMKFQGKNTMKILIPLHTMPDVKSVTTLELENLLPILRNKTKIQVLWLVYTPEKLKQQNISDDVILGYS